MGRLREWRDNNIRVHFQNAYLRTREWKKLRTVSKGRWQCNDAEPADSVKFWQKVLYGGGSGCSYSTAALCWHVAYLISLYLLPQIVVVACL